MYMMRLKEIREDKDIRQCDVAKFLKVTQAQYCRYENGLNAIPVDKLEKLANYYKTSTDYLLYRTDERKPYPKSIINEKRQKEKEHIYS